MQHLKKNTLVKFYVDFESLLQYICGKLRLHTTPYYGACIHNSDSDISFKVET